MIIAVEVTFLDGMNCTYGQQQKKYSTQKPNLNGDSQAARKLLFK